MALTVLSLAPLASAQIGRVAASPFDFAVAKAPRDEAKKRSLFERVFHFVDGGDMHAKHLDPIERKAENALHTLTVRIKGEW